MGFETYIRSFSGHKGGADRGQQGKTGGASHSGSHHHKPAPKRRSFPIRGPVLISAVVALLVLVIGSFGYAATMEERDSFCASCHTQPESTFFGRTQAASVTDLATFHFTKDVKCIDCHSGKGISGRVGAILLGSRNAFLFFTHTAVQPAPLTVPIGDGNCLKCHANVLQSTGDFNNHFHEFLPRWQAVDAKAAGCVSCHTSHNTDGDPQLAYLAQQPVQLVCEQCHSVLAE